MRMKNFKLSGANIFKASDYGSAETALLEACKWDSFYLNETEFEKYDNIKVIPDLHGEYDVFRKFLEKENYFQDKKTAYIFVGDLIDRGSKSKELLDYFLNNDSSYAKYMTNDAAFCAAAVTYALTKSGNGNAITPYISVQTGAQNAIKSAANLLFITIFLL